MWPSVECVFVLCSGVADRGRGVERLCERFFSRGLASNQCVGNRRMKDVAWGPNMETGATVPGYSGGVAACTSFCSRGWALKQCVRHRV